jgi:hypothetical protein
MTVRLKRWTEAGALRETKKCLTRIDALLVDIAGLWGDVDQYIVGRADDLRAEIEQVAKDVEESIRERADRQAEDSP